MGNQINNSNPMGKIDPALIAQILSKVTPALQSKVENQVVNQATQEAAKPTAPSKSGLSKLVKGAGKILGAVAPEVVGLIPGIGPLAKTVLSTLNDDEWFQAYDTAGATFNELLTTNESAGQYIPVIPAIANIKVEHNWYFYKENVFPSILAYVREKTNNVLLEDVDTYSDAINAAVNLYMIYFSLGKYLTLASDLPLNIPVLTDACGIIKPASISVTKGIHAALGDYLKSTISLPYALVEYIRWRFGTIFLSSNTGKPGLISYDPADTDFMGVPAEEAITHLQSMISDYQNTLAAAGRAVADIKLAYQDHQFRMDVEKRHYDEKEFNLRVNFTYGNTPRTPIDDYDRLWTLYMDSRLSVAPALQAVTISTGSTCMFSIPSAPQVYFYAPKSIMVPYETFGGGSNVITLEKGWHHGSVQMSKPATVKMTFEDASDAPSAGDRGIYLMSDDRTKYLSASYDVKEAIVMWIATLGADALQLHNIATEYTLTNDEETKRTFIFTNLSYDRARISGEQLSGIHRSAARNLWRGDYKTKTPTVNKPEVKEAAAAIETAAIKEVL